MSKTEQTLLIVTTIAWLAFSAYTLHQVSTVQPLVKQILTK
jgi:hypothetical protein